MATLRNSRAVPGYLPPPFPVKRRVLQPRQRYMRQYEVWPKDKADDPAWRSMVRATTHAKARYKGFLQLQGAFQDIRFVDVRSRMVGILFAIGQHVPAEEREQVLILRHALGYTDPLGEGTAYRNNYALSANSDGYSTCMAMCMQDVPFMGHRKVDALAEGLVYFHVTLFGKEWVEKRIGMSTNPQQ